MAGSGKFTFIFTEREASAIADALEQAADNNRSDYFTGDTFRSLAHRVDERLHW